MRFAHDHPEIFCLEEHIDQKQMQEGLEAAENLEDARPPSSAQLTLPPISPDDKPPPSSARI